MKRGPKPIGKVKINWSRKFAYAIGLLTADGCLSKDGRHIDLTSKDRTQVVLFKQCLGLDTKVSHKYSGSGNLAYCVQFSDVLFYQFLMTIGLSPAKSKTISSVTIPERYFLDFLRGYFDGDGCSYSYYDTVFKNSYRFYVSFTSASPLFLDWLRAKLDTSLGIRGHIGYYRDSPYVQLRYSKREAVVLCRAMYYRAGVLRLQRKYLKIQRSLSIVE
ncbi:LAGLIDADG family homing endonuclease [Candidatus Kaiserbacteria bacterium]|nr:LAGLIDADG family homing endonuclease [Candidatus Kaiserbacteria bacterium]